MTVEVRRLTADEVERSIDELARLRIVVFRAFPYLYDGDIAYERRYLKTYMESPGAVVIGAYEGRQLVGAATAAPLADHFSEFAEPFARAGLSPEQYFYFGESVLLPAYRGRGVGVRFFDERERAAREQGFAACVFSAVVRPGDHPMRPADYRPLDDFWRNRGYVRVEGLVTEFSWLDAGQQAETPKPMEYWRKFLS